MAGHVFVVWSDLTKLACDAWLVPTDKRLHVESTWQIDPELLAGARPSEAFSNGITRFHALPETSEREPIAILTNVVHHDLDQTIRAAASFVEVAARTVGKRRLPRREKPLYALPLVGTGASGRGRWAGEIVEALLPLLEAQAREHDVDVGLVLFDGVQYAAAQAVRKQRGDVSPELGELERRRAVELASFARAGRLVLFMGAGVAVPAGAPTWRELIAWLATRANLDPDECAALARLGNLDAARVIEQRLGREALSAAVRERIADDRFALTHALLAGLGAREAVTTNYDSLYEKACERPHGGRPAALPVESTRNARGWILKMHGSFAPGDEIVLTRTDYLRYETRRAALAGIVQALLMTKHMLFVGYSLEDETFLRMVDAVRRAVTHDARSRIPDALGTVLSLSSDRFFETLWRGELHSLDFGAPPDASSETLAAASRRQEIFLDHLSTESTSATGHLLDPRYARVLTPADRELAEALDELEQRLSRSKLAKSSAAWDAVQTFLEELGGQGSNKRPNKRS